MVTNKQLREELRKNMEARADLIDRKNSGYAGGDDESNAFKNFDLVSILSNGKVTRETGMFVRMTDKLARLGTLMFGGADKVGEAVDDTLDDLAAYADLTLVAWRDTMKRKEVQSDEEYLEALKEEQALQAMIDKKLDNSFYEIGSGYGPAGLNYYNGDPQHGQAMTVAEYSEKLAAEEKETPKSILSRFLNLGRDGKSAG